MSKREQQRKARLREPPCHYAAHRDSDWALAGNNSTIWTCGVCHPPVAFDESEVIRRRDQPALTYDPAAVIPGKPSEELLTPRELELAERYRRLYPWMDGEGSDE